MPAFFQPYRLKLSNVPVRTLQDPLPHLRNHATETVLRQARKTLASLNASERSERHWLQTTQARLQASGSDTPEQAELLLELETHRANIETIEAHIEQLQSWIEEARLDADAAGRAVMRMIEARARH